MKGFKAYLTKEATEKKQLIEPIVNFLRPLISKAFYNEKDMPPELKKLNYLSNSHGQQDYYIFAFNSLWSIRWAKFRNEEGYAFDDAAAL